MPPKNTRLVQMLIAEQKKREKNDREVAEILGVSQQTYHSWKRGTIPREPFHGAISRFLGISIEMMEELAEEARTSKGSTKLPPIKVFDAAREYGKVSDRKSGQFKFEPVNAGRKAIPEGRYSVVMDTKIMEPVFRVGTKIWLDPAVWPRVGDDVMVHSEAGRAWIGRLVTLGDAEVSLDRYAGEPVVVKNVRAVHTVVLAERV